MKSLFLIALMAIPASALAVENREKYEAYKQRRADRRAYALDSRRQYNTSKSPHVYRTAIAMQIPVMTPYLAVQEGWVHQPAIPVRPIVAVSPIISARPILAVGHSDPYHHVTRGYRTSYPTAYAQIASKRVAK